MDPLGTPNNIDKFECSAVKNWYYLLINLNPCVHFFCINRVGICGAWSFDTFEGECFLHTAYSCCGQFDKREEDSNFISGYTCNKCWSTRNECPCGRRNPLPYDPTPSEPSTPAVNRQGQALHQDNRLFEIFGILKSREISKKYFDIIGSSFKVLLIFKIWKV